jgi:malonyl-CoA/methylmalonyl-CoA synthetase
MTIRVADAETGGLQPDGAVGQIEVQGPSVFSGYWSSIDHSTDADDATGEPPAQRQPPAAPAPRADFSTDRFFRTGDLGLIDQDGYLHIVGRLKDLIITGGLNVYPKEVEDVLDDLDDVLESAVVGVPDADFGECVVAVVVTCQGTTIDESAMRRAARRRLAPFKVPKRIIAVDALPRNSMGKVEKAHLRRRIAGL